MDAALVNNRNFNASAPEVGEHPMAWTQIDSSTDGKVCEPGFLRAADDLELDSGNRSRAIDQLITIATITHCARGHSAIVLDLELIHTLPKSDERIEGSAQAIRSQPTRQKDIVSQADGRSLLIENLETPWG